MTAAFRGAAIRGVDRGDLIQSLLERLLVSVEGRPPRITEYLGRGSLRSWVRIVCQRLRLDAARRASGREDQLASRVAARVAQELDPELDFLKREYAAVFRAAISAAVAALSAPDRNLLRMQLVEGLSATAIAATRGVHRATAKRWLSDLRQRLFNDTRMRMSAALSVDALELDSIMGLIGSRLDASLSRYLAQSNP